MTKYGWMQARDSTRICSTTVSNSRLSCWGSTIGDGLLKDTRFERAARILPFKPAETILAVGDSNTSDALAWTEILAEVLARVRPPGLRFVNAAVSAGTSGDLIARFHLIAAYQPNWLLIMIGTNDARRHGPNGLARMTSIGETRRNLRALAALAQQQTDAQLVLITPPPVIDDRVRAHRPWNQGSITWRAADVAAVAERVRRTGELVVDAHGALLEGATGSWVSDDGVHLTLAGQQRIVHALVTGLAGHAWSAVDEFVAPYIVQMFLLPAVVPRWRSSRSRSCWTAGWIRRAGLHVGL